MHFATLNAELGLDHLGFPRDLNELAARDELKSPEAGFFLLKPGRDAAAANLAGCSKTPRLNTEQARLRAPVGSRP
jgi:hypothetical protein